jgi:hypothetical protein
LLARAGAKEHRKWLVVDHLLILFLSCGGLRLLHFHSELAGGGHESVFSEADGFYRYAHGCLFLPWSVDVYLSFKSSFARGAEIPPERGEHERLHHRAVVHVPKDFITIQKMHGEAFVFVAHPQSAEAIVAIAIVARRCMGTPSFLFCCRRVL